MATLAARRCFYHVDREAVARCVECTQFYCRECITEYEDRIVCTACLQRLTQPVEAQARRFSFSWLFRFAGVLLGVLVAWLVFHGVGQTLLSIPFDFHLEQWKIGASAAEEFP